MVQVTLDEKDYSCVEVIEKLSQQVTQERLKRVQRVIDHRNPNLVTVMENIYDRGNTSAVMRSAEAFGFHHFHQIIRGDEFKESKRVTQGADKWLIHKHWDSTETCIESLKSQGLKILVTHLDGGIPLEEVPIDGPVALCFGNERDGASAELTQLADHCVYIPMDGFVQSFNISVAAALCFQTLSRRLQALSLTGVSDEERQYLMALYLHRSCKNPAL
ncbi:MAG: RNA methyltransferase [Pseudomonadota bacterium]